MATISILKKSRAPSRNVFCEGLGFEALTSSLLFSVIHLGDEKITLGVRGLNLHDIVLSTVDHRVEPWLDLGGLLIPVTLVARDEHHAKVVTITSTGSIVGNLGRSEISRRVRCFHGSDVVFATVDHRVEPWLDLGGLLIPVTLVARDREQTQVAATHRLRAHFEGLRRFGVVLTASNDEEQKPEKHERKHYLPDFHQNFLCLGFGMCYRATMTRFIYCLQYGIFSARSQAQTKNQHFCCPYSLSIMDSWIKKFSSPKMQNRQFIFTPKIEYKLVAERSEANPSNLQFPTWCRRRDLNSHDLRHTILSRACLPFHHSGLYRGIVAKII